jgi:hypothetical protein
LGLEAREVRNQFQQHPRWTGVRAKKQAVAGRADARSRFSYPPDTGGDAAIERIQMKPEVYRRMKVAGRLLVLIGLSVPAVLILLLFLRLRELVVLAARECAVLAVGFIVIGAVLWAGGWILEGNTP